MNLDLQRLANVKAHDNGWRAACPACREAGADKTGDHLFIRADGRFGCVAHPGDRPHRQRIFALARRPPLPPETAWLGGSGRFGRLFATSATEKHVIVCGHLGRSSHTPPEPILHSRVDVFLERRGRKEPSEASATIPTQRAKQASETSESPSFAAQSEKQPSETSESPSFAAQSEKQPSETSETGWDHPLPDLDEEVLRWAFDLPPSPKPIGYRRNGKPIYLTPR
jgi:hypothetical protein